MPTFDEWRTRGGINGEVRRIVLRWRFPFTVRAIKLAFIAEWPTLDVDEQQIRDILDRMARFGDITPLPYNRYDPRPSPKVHPRLTPARRRARKRLKQLQLAL